MSGTAREEERRESALIGARFGQYRVVEEIGRGGMGVVYRAVHEGIGQAAAVKVLGGERARDAATLRRFVNEARAASLVEHPGMVKVFDFGETEDGAPFILMEYLAGEPLRARMERARSEGRALSVVEALRVARQAAAALSAVHAMGIVHRDLKPENLMVVADDEAAGGERVKVLDFGIARISDDGATLTAPGVVVGSAAYMAPEQCVGDDEIDGRADVYALGVVLYEMLSGAPPFRGDFRALLGMHLYQQPRPLSLACPELPEGVARLVHRMLAKEPSLRPDMAGVVEALRRLEAEAKEGAAASAARVDPQAATVDPQAATVETRPGAATTVGERRAEAPVTTIEVASEVRLEPARPLRRRRRWPAAVALLALAAAAIPAARRWRARPVEGPPVALQGMAWIAGATFRMGSTKEEIGAECARLGAQCRRELLEREQPAREVTVSGFHLDVHETTNQEFADWLDGKASILEVREDRDEHWPRFVHAGGALLVDLYPARGGVVRAADGHFSARPGMERRPVVQVTWDAARMFCAERGKRLPTEAEWELAARGRERRAFPWGSTPPRCEGAVIDRLDGRCRHLPAGPADVGTAPDDVTPEGVRDLAGNVHEWVHDEFLAPYYPPCGACRDPRVESAAPPAEDLRIRRGGTWSTFDGPARGAARSRWKRSDVLDGLGFRCASR
jgi:formylglycine-generating enzyme required for sulfatase activity/predicted Ser/Thr protein kinase